MGVDKGYGSGKSRSAANSRARQRAAAGNFTKGPKKMERTLKKIAAENPVTGFIGGGIGVGTKAISLLRSANALTSGARRMTTAERSAAVTRAGRTGVGKIGASTKIEQVTDPYYEAYSRAASIYEKRTGKYAPDTYVEGFAKGVPLNQSMFKNNRVYSNRAVLETVQNANKSKAKFQSEFAKMSKSFDDAQIAYNRNNVKKGK